MLDLALSHSWDITPREAVALQRQLAPQVERTDRLPALKLVAGIDVGFEESGHVTRAAVAILAYPSLQPVAQAIARQPTRFPYVPGLLSFREIPAVLAALDQLQTTPDLLLVDGQGLAHPRRLGIACHLGLLTGLPSIGVAKTRLVGEETTPGPNKGDWTPITHKSETIGALLRTRCGVKPIYVSQGHRISLATAIHVVLACTPRYRLPETTRAAHRLASG